MHNMLNYQKMLKTQNVKKTFLDPWTVKLVTHVYNNHLDTENAESADVPYRFVRHSWFPWKRVESDEVCKESRGKLEDGLAEVFVHQAVVVRIVREVWAIDEDTVGYREEVDDIVDVTQQGDLCCLQHGVKAATPRRTWWWWGRQAVDGVLVCL